MSKAGLKIWVIEKFEKKEVPRSEFGKFFTGDSYIVLKEKKDKEGKIAWDLHMWIGDKSTQDEYGACAILTTQLDDEMGGTPVQFRETQGNESSTFLGYFRPAIQYKAGGTKSGFRHVTINDFSEIKRLLWVRGRHQVRADEVELSWSSLNNADCFIFDMGLEIFIWHGKKSNHFERLQATNVANSIKNDERGGKARVRKWGSSEDELSTYLGAKPGPIADGAPEAPRAKISVKAGKRIELYKVSDASGDVETTLISDKPPFKQCMLDSGDVFLINNTAAGQIFVWKGKGASKDERKAAMKTAVGFIEKFKLPKNTKVTVMAQNGETALFKTLFRNWRNLNAQQGLGKTWSINKTAKIAKVDFDASQLLQKPDLAAKYQLPDDGSGSVKVFRVEGSDKNEIDPSTYGQFYGGDCYIISYTYSCRGREKTILYYWIGSKATKDEVTALPLLTIQLDNDVYKGSATQVRVTQGHEPPHMMLLFGGSPLIINDGGTSRDGGQTESASKRLFHVKSGMMGKCRAVEVACEASKLNSNDTFLLITPSGSFNWVGKGACEQEKEGCAKVSEALGVSGCSVIDEGDEPDNFWDELGGKAEYHTSPQLEDKDTPIRLFECCDSTGNFVVEEVVGDWTQSDLNPDNVMLLDAWSALYVWIGKAASENEQKEAMKTSEDYVNLDSSERSADSTPIIRIMQGQEPASFSGFFQGWDDSLFA